MPPIRTKSTWCSSSLRKMGRGWKSACSGRAKIPPHEVRKRRTEVDPLFDRAPQVVVKQCHVVAVVDRLRVELQLLAEQVQELRKRVDRGGDQVALDPRNGGLGGPSPCG